VDILDAHPELRVMIVGHSDGRGDYAANLQLSQMRASTVREYLLGQSKNRRQLARRLQAIGLGSTQPIADNDSAVGRARNRRVELRIVTTLPAPAPSQPDATAP
jgi:outer membrane protein OmpA-like peptidoglycan-associated protein